MLLTNAKRPGGLPVLVLLLSLGFARPAEAQLLEVPLIIQQARVLSPSGDTSDELTIVCRGGRIATIAKQVDLPLFKRIVDAKDRVVTAGLIDVSSTLGTSPRSAAPDATQRAEDDFDAYATAAIEQALRAGVTSVYVPTRGAGGITGRGALLRLEATPSGGIGMVLSRGALDVDLGASLSPIARVRAFGGLRRKFESALEHRRALDDYEEALESYVKALEESAKKSDETETSKDSKDSKDSKNPKAAEKPKKDGASKKDDASKKERPKKPKKPARNAELEVLLQALDREFPVRISAHRSDDILNALALAAEFELDLVLAGATEAHLVSEEIPSEIPVVVDTTHSTELPDAPLRSVDDLAARLRARGLETYAGSGAGGESRFLPSLAELHGRGESPSELLALVTLRAAKLLGAEKEIGAVKRGMRADLVVWSGPPFEVGSRVEVVIVGGRMAYQRGKDTP